MTTDVQLHAFRTSVRTQMQP